MSHFTESPLDNVLHLLKDIAANIPSSFSAKRGAADAKESIDSLLQSFFDCEPDDVSRSAARAKVNAAAMRQYATKKRDDVEFRPSSSPQHEIIYGCTGGRGCSPSPQLVVSFSYEDDQIKLELSSSEVTQILAIAKGLSSVYSSVRSDSHIRGALNKPEQDIFCEFKIKEMRADEFASLTEIKISVGDSGQYGLECRWKSLLSDEMRSKHVAIIKNGQLISLGNDANELARAAVFLQDALNVFAHHPEHSLAMIASVLRTSHDTEDSGYFHDQVSNWAGSLLASYCHPDRETKPLQLAEFNALMQCMIASVPQVKAALGTAGERLQVIADATVQK